MAGKTFPEEHYGNLLRKMFQLGDDFLVKSVELGK
jgi:hypothetical protein